MDFDLEPAQDARPVLSPVLLADTPDFDIGPVDSPLPSPSPSPVPNIFATAFTFDRDSTLSDALDFDMDAEDGFDLEVVVEASSFDLDPVADRQDVDQLLV